MGALLPFQDIFEFKCLLDDLNIRLSSRIENGVKQLLALITDDDDILLYYMYGELCSILKRVPWFNDPNKSVQALCFDPSATWLLVVCLDCSLYIIPALSLVDKKQKIDCKWSVHDLTHFPKPPQVTDSKPTSLVWWQTLDCNQNALIGFENGSISLISLTDGRCFGNCSITKAIIQLNLFHDNTLDAVSLMINGVSGQQWKLVLEQHSIGYLWPPDANNLTDDVSRSRLQNLRQLSAEKLAYFKQKFTENKHSRRDSQNSDSESVSSENSHSGPELLPHLCDTHFSPQFAKNRYLFSAFYKPTCLVTVHSGDVETAPLYIHKLQQKTDYLLLTDRLIYTVNSEANILSILSSQLSECRLEGDSEFNEDALIAQFTMIKENEKIINIYKLTDNTISRERRKKDDPDARTNILPRNVSDLLISRVKVDTCVVVTNVAVYKLITKCSPVNKFISLIIEDNNLEKAERLAVIFGLNLQRLFESCGDLLVSNGSFHQGLILYKQAKIHLLKRVLKLAVAADCKSLLKFIHLCLNASRVDMSIGTKIHIGNLAVMAYTELLLRFNGQMRISNTKDFLNFLCFEEYYDQVLAINVACQASHWKVVNLLTKARGLQPETVVAISQILQTTRAPRPTEYDFLLALSEPSLLQSMLIYPTSCQIILNYVKDNLNSFPMSILKRLALQLDPSQPVALPLLHRLHLQRQKKESSSDSLDDALDFDPAPQMFCILKEVIETFIHVLLVIVQQSEEDTYKLELLEKIPQPEYNIREELSIPKFPKTKVIDCGYEHIGVVRNSNLYMMGISTSGCLGLGPILTQSSPLKLVSTLSELKVKVLSVSCGRKHTLVLTDFGVYSWGSNYYGQLGLDPLLQETPYPQMILALNSYKIIDVQAGQYHSMALTCNGKVFTWGWGIHGQLGHGKSSNEFYPLELEFEEPVMQMSAGYAHSFILTITGKLYGFGSNAFGQLETCNIEGSKTTRPTWVLVMPDFYTPIEKIFTSYFHNICTTSDQEVFVWGASPQEVRISQSKSNQKLNGIDPKMADSWKSCVRIYTSSSNKNVEEVSVGFKYSAILHGGKIIWGKSKEVELLSHNSKKETASLVPKYIHVASGYDYVLAIEYSGKLVAWGNTTFAQKIISKQQNEDGSSILSIRTTKGRCVKVPNTKEGTFESPIEIPGLPSIQITYDIIDYRLSNRTYIPYAIRSVENNIIDEKRTIRPVSKSNLILDHLQDTVDIKIGVKTLHYVLETYTGLYDYENVLTKCLECQNYQAASKVAIVDEHYGDSLSFQLKALKTYMDGLDLEFNINVVPKEDICNKKNELNKHNDINSAKIQYSSQNSPARVLSNSSSLDSIRQWAEDEHQGGCESPCELSELGDIKQNMSQYVQSFKSDSPSINTVSEIISSQPTYPDHKSNEFDFEVYIKDPNTRNVINIASSIVEYYIKKTYATENHILMQNVLMKCIEFWLNNNLPVCILEKVLLKNMDKYFYPLSILLFCKNFNNNLGDKNELDPKEQKPAGFLKDFSTKFCLQLCSMVLENVNKA